MATPRSKAERSRNLSGHYRLRTAGPSRRGAPLPAGRCGLVARARLGYRRAGARVLAARPALGYHSGMREQNRNEPCRGELGPLYDVRLGDLRAWHEARARCPRCRRDGRVSLDAIGRKAGPEERLLGIARWLRCGGCGHRVGNEVYLVKLGRD